MSKYRFSVIIIAILLIALKVSAQTTTSNNIGYINGVTVNFMDIANYEKAHPQPLVRKLPFDEGEESGDRPYQPPVDPATIRMYNPDVHGAEGPHVAYLPVSPTPADTFLAKVSDGTSIPPDTHGAVDSMCAVTAINSSITIENRYTHAVVSTVTLDGFWSSMEAASAGGHGAGAYDPRVHYDPHYKRWIMMADAYGETTYSTLFIAVSATSSPTGAWHMYKLSVAGAGGIWLDFPCVGFNKRWIAISGNFFTSTGSYTNDIIYVFDYIAMMSGGTLSWSSVTPPSSSFTICPALTYDTTETNLFCVENYSGGAGQLKLFKLTGNIGSLSLAAVGTPATATHWQQSNGSGNDFVPQLAGGTSYLLQANDDRINNFVQRNNKLWCAHTVFLPATGTPTRVSAMWWQMDTTGTPAQVGLVDDPTGANYYWFPSIAPNASDDALIGFATSSTAIHPSCAYALHIHTDAVSTWRPVFTYRHGQKVYFQNFGSGQDRWGDYSATCIDPVNNLDFWTIQESVPSTSPNPPNSLWDTWWAHVVVCTPLGATPVPATITLSPCTGTIAPYSVDTVAGATSYTWIVSGTGWSGTSTTDSINLTVGTGVATISVAPTNSCAPGSAPYVFTVSPSPLPVETLTVSPSPLCAGSTAAIFTATATGSPTSYTWTVLGTGWSGSSTSSTLNATAGTGPGTIIVHGTNGCGVGPNDTLIVTPSNGPSVGPITSTPAIVCSSSSAVFSVPPVTGATGYTWTILGTGWSGSSTTNSVTATVGTGTGMIIVSATDACGTGANDTLIVTTSTGAPTPTSITGSVPLCADSVAIYTTPAVPGATSYVWTISGTGWSGTSTTNSITATVGSGAGTISVSAVDACGTGTPFTLSGIIPTVVTSSFVESTHTTFTHTNIIIDFTGTAPSGSTYLWNFGGGGGIGSPGPTYAGPQTVHWDTSGLYTVTLTINDGGCVSISTDTVLVNYGLAVKQVNVNSFEANITPNPNDGSFDIIFDMPVTHPLSVKISDMEGRTVYTNEFSATNNNKISIVTDHLAAGNYNVTIYQDEAVITKKVTIGR